MRDLRCDPGQDRISSFLLVHEAQLVVVLHEPLNDVRMVPHLREGLRGPAHLLHHFFRIERPGEASSQEGEGEVMPSPILEGGRGP